MLVIALDTSTPAVSAGLVDWADTGPRSLAERVTVNPRAHGELLTPQLLDVLNESGHQLPDVDAIVVGSGPGPFTGLRVGMVTGSALGHAAGVGVYPVCSLDGIAAQIPGDARLLIATDARRNEVYWAAYDTDRTRLAGPHVQRPQDAADEIAELGIGLAAGEKAADVVPGIDIVEPGYPTPAGLVTAAGPELRAGADPRPLVPLYLRRPDAQAPGPPKSVSTTRGPM